MPSAYSGPNSLSSFLVGGGPAMTVRVRSLCRNLGGAAGTGAVENQDPRSVAFGGSAVFCSFGRMAGRLGVEARKLHKLVLVKEAAPIYHGP